MSNHHELRLAIRDAAPLLLALAPFGAVYGAIAIDTGLTLTQTLGFSLAVYAGASQLLGLQLLTLGAPVWAILISIFALNFRHILYSASIGRRFQRFSRLQKALGFFLLVDPLFAAAESRVTRHVLTKSYYFTFGLILYVGWFFSSLAGALFGGLIEDPRAFGLDLVLPIYFLAQTMAFRTRDGFLPVFIVSALASILVYLTIGSPWHVTLGGIAGIAVAALRTPPALPEEAK